VALRGEAEAGEINSRQRWQKAKEFVAGSIGIIIGAIVLIYYIATSDGRAMASANKVICRRCGTLSTGKIARATAGYF